MSTSFFILYTQLHHLIEALKTHSLLPLIWCPWDDCLWIRGVDIDRDRKKAVTQEYVQPLLNLFLDLKAYNSSTKTDVLASKAIICEYSGDVGVCVEYCDILQCSYMMNDNMTTMMYGVTCAVVNGFMIL